MQVLNRGLLFVDNICQTKAVGVPHSQGFCLVLQVETSCCGTRGKMPFEVRWLVLC
jgi:hypothetical protein